MESCTIYFTLLHLLLSGYAVCAYNLSGEGKLRQKDGAMRRPDNERKLEREIRKYVDQRVRERVCTLPLSAIMT